MVERARCSPLEKRSCSLKILHIWQLLHLLSSWKCLQNLYIPLQDWLFSGNIQKLLSSLHAHGFQTIGCTRIHMNASQNSQALPMSFWFQIYLHEHRNLHFEKAPPPPVVLLIDLGSLASWLWTCCSLCLCCFPPFCTWPTSPHCSRLSSNKGYLFCEAFSNFPQLGVSPSRYHSNFHACLISMVIYVKSYVPAGLWTSAQRFLCPFYVQHVSPCQAHGRHSPNISWIDECMNPGDISMNAVTVNWFSSTL